MFINGPWKSYLQTLGFQILYIKVNYTRHTAHYLHDAQELEDTTFVKDDYVDTTMPTSTCAKGPYELDKELHMLWDLHNY